MGEQASQEDIWDDRLLIESWDTAVDEYRNYHSIAARGEDIEEAIRLYEETEAREALSNNADIDDSHEQQESNIKSEVNDAVHITANTGDHVEPDIKVEPGMSPQHVQADPIPATSIAATLSASIPDEAMKNLMMSWYYAGYYTGRIEGRREAVAEQARSA